MPSSQGLTRLAACALALLALAAVPRQAAAQVTVAPTMLFLGHGARFGTFIVNNQSGAAQEVTIGFRFGYPVTDSLANGSMIYGDTIPGAATRSATTWVRAFPRQFVLPSGQQQVVRFIVRPPDSLAGGIYWTRIVTTSAPQSPPVDTVGGGVAARIVFRLEQVTTLFYENGTLKPALEIGDIRSWVDSTKAAFIVPVTQTGNTPILGAMTLRVLGPNGAVVGRGMQVISIYFNGRVAFSVARKTLRPGRYTAEFTVTPKRSDIPPGQQLEFRPVTRKVSFLIPG